MKCYKHYDREAVATCVDCGKALCPECTNIFTVPLCNQCAISLNEANKRILIRNSIIMVILFVIGFSCDSTISLLNRLLTGYLFAGIPWGWSALNRITPNIFLFMSWIGWIIYFIIKLTIAMIIGMFVTPFKIYGIVKGLSDSRHIENYTNNINI